MKSDAQLVAELLDGDRGPKPASFWCLLKLHRWGQWGPVLKRAMRRTYSLGGLPLPDKDHDFVQHYQIRVCLKCGLHREQVLGNG